MQSANQHPGTDEDSQTVGPRDWHERDPGRWARPPPIRARRQEIYNLPSAICLWLNEAIKCTERRRQPPANTHRNNNVIEYLLFYDEVRCIVNLDIGQVYRQT